MSSVSAALSGVRRGHALPVAAVLVTVTLWASAFVGIRYADRVLPPGGLALARLLVGSAVLAAAVLLRPERFRVRGVFHGLAPSDAAGRRALGGVAVCGVLWFGLYNVFLNEAEKRVDAGIAAMLVSVGPILIAILAGVFPREGFPLRLVFGCLLSFAGAAIIGTTTSEHGLRGTWGAALCLLAALAYAGGAVAQKPALANAGGAVAQKPALANASALTVTWLGCVVGAATCLPYLPSLIDRLGQLSASGIAWTIYLGAAPTAIGVVTWAYALARTTAGRMGSTTYLVPPLAVLLGWALLGEVPPALAIPGGGCAWPGWRSRVLIAALRPVAWLRRTMISSCPSASTSPTPTRRTP